MLLNLVREPRHIDSAKIHEWLMTVGDDVVVACLFVLFPFFQRNSTTLDWWILSGTDSAVGALLLFFSIKTSPQDQYHYLMLLGNGNIGN